jgi:hypothetical protein
MVDLLWPVEIGNEKITLPFKVLLISEGGIQVYKVRQWDLKSYQLHSLFPTDNKLHKFKSADVWFNVPDSYSRYFMLFLSSCG